jgi:hypothetical protein
VANTRGDSFAVGDADHAFSIQSVSKPFVFALVCDALGPDEAERLLGVDATGQPFNSVMAIELRADRTTNPLVNSGAIATTSLIPGASSEDRWRRVRDGLSLFAGRRLELDERVYASEAATNERNAGIAHLLRGYGRVYCDPDEATDVYTRQCSLLVTARDLATMGATLADGGVNPATGERVVSAGTCRARGDGHRGPVRALRPLALRRGPARQERRERRHRHRCARQGGAGHVLAATGRGRQQRARAARHPLPVRAARAEPVCVRAGRARRLERTVLTQLLSLADGA